MSEHTTNHQSDDEHPKAQETRNVSPSISELYAWRYRRISHRHTACMELTVCDRSAASSEVHASNFVKVDSQGSEMTTYTDQCQI